MAPPAKRQKRLIVLSSDEDEDDNPSFPKSQQVEAQAATARAASSNGTAKQSLPTRSRPKPTCMATQTRSDSSPKKARKSKTVAKPRSSKPISMFFNTTNQSQPLNRQSRVVNPDIENEVEDLIEDDSPLEEAEGLRRVQESTRIILDRRKRPREDKLLGGSQRFKYTGNASGNVTEVKRMSSVDSRPWAERFGPDNLEELMVHKKKVSDVRNWLDNVLRGRERKRLLILTGPSGAGKTATVSTLSQDMGFELSEWRNPVGSEFSSEGYLSMSAQFEDFLGRSGRFNRLDIFDNARKVQAATQDENHTSKVILIEEFPNTFQSTSSALRSFRSNILEFLAVNTPSLGAMLSKKGVDNITPVVIIITETRLTTTTAASDSFTAHRLLGSEILSHPGVSVIDFNPIATTLLTNALDLVIQKEARQSGRRRIPGPSVLKRLSEVGDVRSAIGSLEFLCLRGEDNDDWGGRVASKGKKGVNGASAITMMERESLEMITQRESTLGLFHAVGKVVYNKRDDAIDASLQPPDHLPDHRRLRVSQVSVDSLIDETGTDTGTFIAALHENYVLSCEGHTFLSTMNDCLDALSDSDVLGSPRRDRYRPIGEYAGRSFQGAASDSLRQDEICFQLAVRGLLFALPDPVKRRAHPVAGKGAGKSDTYKMFYPTSMRLSRQMEEIDSLVSRWTDGLRAGVGPLRQPASNAGRQFVNLESNRQKSASTVAQDFSQHSNREGFEPFRTNLHCTKAELLLERLPYVTRITQRNATSAHLGDLEKITRFHGINVPQGEDSEEEGADERPPAAEWTTDRPVDSRSEGTAISAALRHGVEKDATTVALPAEEEVEKMYLSDDDIED